MTIALWFGFRCQALGGATLVFAGCAYVVFPFSNEEVRTGANGQGSLGMYECILVLGSGYGHGVGWMCC